MRSLFNVILLVITFTQGLCGQNYIVNSNSDNLKIENFTYVIDNDNSFAIEDIISDESKNLFQQKTSEFEIDFQIETYWIKFDLTNEESELVDYMLEFPNWAYADLYYRDQKDLIHRASGLALNHAAINFPLGLNNLLEVSIEGGQKMTCYVKLRQVFLGGIQPSNLNSAVSQKDRIVKRKYISQAFSFMFLGIILIMFFYNLFIYISTGDKTYRFYLLSLLIYVFILFGISGAFYYMVPQLESGPLLFLNFMSTQSILITLSVLYFVKDFYRVSDRYPKWGKAVDYFSVFLGVVLVILLFKFDLAINLMVISVIPFMVIVFAVGFKSLRDGFPGSIYVLVAHVIWFVFGIAGMLGQVHPQIKEIEFFRSHAVYTGAVLEMLLFALALANTINYLMRENKEKQSSIIRHLKENASLQTKVNRELEDKVKERTKEISLQNQKIEAQKQNLEVEKERAEGLLLNILPDAVAEELKTTGIATPKYYENVTVLFVDITKFSSMVRKLSSKQLVEGLDFLFSEFDDVTTKYGLEKIKTIGDAYMCVGGLPELDENHPLNAVNAAFEMLEITQSWVSDKIKVDVDGINLRAGLHTGPVTAGVVGKKKFQFDIWGDAVNLASRMESGSAPGKINISESTYNVIKDHFSCSFRGKFAVKNMGEVNMYFVDKALS